MRTELDDFFNDICDQVVSGNLASRKLEFVIQFLIFFYFIETQTHTHTITIPHVDTGHKKSFVYSE